MENGGDGETCNHYDYDFEGKDWRVEVYAISEAATPD